MTLSTPMRSHAPRLTLSVASGKGGTGKTLVSTALAKALAASGSYNVQLLDCDVEEPNADLLLHPRIQHNQPVEVLIPKVKEALCTHCGLCAQFCQSSAIAVIRDAAITFPELCSSCGGCALVCPEDAIAEVPRQVGTVAKGLAEPGIEFYQGRLRVGEHRATPTIRATKEFIAADSVTVIDAPPGTACPMQETVEDSDFCILVTEPTPFGLSDLRLSVDTVRALGVPFGVVINRDGIGDAGVADYCDEQGIEVLLRVPQDRAIGEAYSRGTNLVDALPQWREPLLALHDAIASRVSAP